MFSCLQILEAFLWFVLITLLNVTLIILTLSVSRLLNLLLRLVAFLLFLNPQCFEMDAVGALRLSPLRRGLAIDSTVDIFTFYVPHRHVYGEQWIKFMKD